MRLLSRVFLSPGNLPTNNHLWYGLSREFTVYINLFFRYFGAAKDLPGVRELFEQERKSSRVKEREGRIYTSQDSFHNFLAFLQRLHRHEKLEAN